ncbi:MAG: hypothetical protein PVH88_06620 [Ignavibacteria bacterium]|jgi:hypothetical protein
MSSFSCQYIDLKDGYCLRLKKECVPGRPGCVLYGKVQFAVPAEQRIKEKSKAEECSIKEKYGRKNRKQ